MPVRGDLVYVLFDSGYPLHERAVAVDGVRRKGWKYPVRRPRKPRTPGLLEYHLAGLSCWYPWFRLVEATVSTLLGLMRRRGFTVRYDEAADKILVRPADRVTPALAAEIRARRDELVDALRAERRS